MNQKQIDRIEHKLDRLLEFLQQVFPDEDMLLEDSDPDFLEDEGWDEDDNDIQRRTRHD